MNRSKVYVTLALLALLGAMGLVQKAGEAFAEFQKAQTEQFKEATGQ
jgi:hypothetical protein